MREAKNQRRASVVSNPTSGLFVGSDGIKKITKTKARQLYKLNDSDIDTLEHETVPNTHPFAQTPTMAMYFEEDCSSLQERKDALKRSKKLAQENDKDLKRKKRVAAKFERELEKARKAQRKEEREREKKMAAALKCEKREKKGKTL